MKRVLILGMGLWFTEVKAQSLAAALTPLDTIVAKKDTLREVVVTGQYMPQSVRNSVYRVKSINSEQIRLRGSTSIENVLNTELGIRFSNDLTLGEADIELMGMK